MLLIVSASPNAAGLTAACVEAATQGSATVGSAHLDLCKLRIERCQQCENGWGRCRREHRCIIEDDLPRLQQALAGADGLIIVSPVYYGELAESAKCAFDRLRRCEATRGEQSVLNGMPVICIAAAGGSGGGITNCLTEMERLVQHLRGQIADLIGVTQRNRGYKLDTICAAVTALAGK